MIKKLYLLTEKMQLLVRKFRNYRRRISLGPSLKGIRKAYPLGLKINHSVIFGTKHFFGIPRRYLKFTHKLQRNSRVNFSAGLSGKKCILTNAFFGLIAMGLMFVHPTVYAKDKNSIQIKGSDTMVNLGQAWAEKYMEKNPADFIAVTGGGSGTGFASLISGTCDIAMSSRDIKNKEISLAKKKGITPFEIKVALDGLAVVVSPKNPINELTLEQIAQIFTGKIINWKELGGQDQKIVILSREVNSGTHVYFKEHVLRKNGPNSKEEFAPSALMLPSSQAIADEVAANPAAIGYYGMGYISNKQKAIAIAKDAKSKAIVPTIENVINGQYPISRPLFLYTNCEPQGLLKKFIDFILSKEGQEIVKQTDFVPVKR